MADSLDDFFAKKDKKKSKDKAKAAALTSEALVRELEEGSKQLDYPVRKDNKTSNVVELLGLDADDADWRNFEDVEKRDYTGLKVKEMSLQDQADEEQRHLSEQVETLPESTPWKLKDEQTPSLTSSSATNTEATAAAALNSDAKQPKADATTTLAEKLASNKTSDTSNTPVVSSSSSSNTLSSISAATPVATTEENSTAKQNSAESANEQPKPEGDIKATDKEAPAAASTDDSSKSDIKPSAKKAYVPPQARRLNSEIKILEPSKLGKSRNVSSRSGPIPDIKDEQLFPSLG